MAVTNVNSSAAPTTAYNTGTVKATEKNEKPDSNTAVQSSNNGDKDKGKDKGYVNDVKYTPDMDKVNSMIKEAEQKMSSFISMVEKLIVKQGSTVANIFDAIRQGQVEVDEATRLQAEQDVSDDGYYGVEKTSERIFDFAVAISGGDPSKIEKLREAVEKGFKGAEKIWGGELPEISQKTYDAVMKKFDNWAEESKKATESGNVSEAV